MALTQVKAAGLAADLIDETKLADNSIDSEHYNDGSIDNEHLADNAVGTDEIADDAVTADKLANSINTEIAANTAKVTNATHTGDVTGSGALTIADNAVTLAKLEHGDGTSNGKFLRSNDGADPTWETVSSPVLDAPVITGDLVGLDIGATTHTITNYSASCQYTITPTNCTVSAVSASGTFTITATSHVHPSYTIKASSNSLGLDDSIVVTKTFTDIKLAPPTISAPADASINTNIVYTITSATTNDDKLILDVGSSNFSYQSVSHGSASKVGNTVEVTGFSTNNPAVTIQFTAAATYSVKAKAIDTGGDYADSDYSAVDSITAVDPPYNVDFLVVAGGGGGSSRGGGAGAGGLRASWNSETSGGGGSSETALSLMPSTQYTITVGTGGASQSNYDITGSNGNPSSISGSNITDITTVGGGGGGSNAAQGNPGDGGSGGGGGYTGYSIVGGVGTANQGYDGGDASGTAAYPSGGGGGAGGLGGDGIGNNSQCGHGGVGLASTITGSSVMYAGGGGGSGNPAASMIAGNGGSGGGGGGNNSGNGADGTDGLGGGAGGAYDDPGGSGGDGVVILRMATAKYSGTTTGSPTVTTSGSDTILKYLSDGTYTA